MREEPQPPASADEVDTAPLAATAPPQRTEPTDTSAPPSRRLLYIGAAAAVVAIVAAALLIPRSPTPVSPAPSPSTQNTVPQPRATQPQPPPPLPPAEPIRPGANVDEQVQARLTRARALIARGQPQAALPEIQAALELKNDDANVLALREQMVRDAASQLQRARDEARGVNADKTAAKEYAQAAAQERAAQRERQAGRITQALPLLWSGRSQYLAAAEAARVADQAAKDQAKEQATREQATREQALREQAAREQTAKELAAKEQAAKDQAAREQATRDQAAKEQAARDQATRDQAAREQTTRDRARLQQLDEQAVTRTIREYESAFMRRDADAVARVQVLSGQQLAELRKSMAGSRAYNVSVQINETRFSADRSQVTISATVNRQYVPLSGSAENRSVAQTFTLEKRGESWMIVSLR
jgi:hypothetical protein